MSDQNSITQAVAQIVSTLIEQKCISTNDQVSEAIKVIKNALR